MDSLTVIRAIATKRQVSFDDIMGRSRQGNIVQARREAMNEIWRSTDLTLTEIGEIFGGRTAATVHNAITIKRRGGKN